MAEVERKRFVEDHHIDVDAEPRAHELSRQPERALDQRNGGDDSKLEKDELQRSIKGRLPSRPRRRRVRGDNGIDDELAEVGHERGQGGRDQRQEGQEHSAAW